MSEAEDVYKILESWLAVIGEKSTEDEKAVNLSRDIRRIMDFVSKPRPTPTAKMFQSNYKIDEDQLKSFVGDGFILSVERKMADQVSNFFLKNGGGHFEVQKDLQTRQVYIRFNMQVIPPIVTEDLNKALRRAGVQ